MNKRKEHVTQIEKQKLTKKRKLNEQIFTVMSLHVDLLCSVFEFLDCFALSLIEYVCQKWYQATKQKGQYLWKLLALRECESLKQVQVPKFEPHWKSFYVLRLLSGSELRQYKMYMLQKSMKHDLFGEEKTSRSNNLPLSTLPENEKALHLERLLESMNWMKIDQPLFINTDNAIEFMYHVC